MLDVSVGLVYIFGVLELTFTVDRDAYLLARNHPESELVNYTLNRQFLRSSVRSSPILHNFPMATCTVDWLRLFSQWNGIRRIAAVAFAVSIALLSTRNVLSGSALRYLRWPNFVGFEGRDIVGCFGVVRDGIRRISSQICKKSLWSLHYPPGAKRQIRNNRYDWWVAIFGIDKKLFF